MRINVGCGSTPTPGWENFDNSPSVLLARVPYAGRVLFAAGLIGERQRDFIDFASRHRIRWADATRRLPLPDGSVEVLYSSHMLCCLDRAGSLAFLREVRRVLRTGGIVRIADADTSRVAEVPDASSTLAQRRLLAPRMHATRHDPRSLTALLLDAGFTDPVTLPAGQTTIPSPAPLDLHERADEACYVEAHR